MKNKQPSIVGLGPNKPRAHKERVMWTLKDEDGIHVVNGDQKITINVGDYHQNLKMAEHLADKLNAEEKGRVMQEQLQKILKDTPKRVLKIDDCRVLPKVSPHDRGGGMVITGSRP